MMHLRPSLFALETRVMICAGASLALLAISLLLAFVGDRAAFWPVKISTGIAAACAAVLVVLNIVMHG